MDLKPNKPIIYTNSMDFTSSTSEETYIKNRKKLKKKKKFPKESDSSLIHVATHLKKNVFVVRYLKEYILPLDMTRGFPRSSIR
jgi:hypothetical protein